MGKESTDRHRKNRKRNLSIDTHYGQYCHLPRQILPSLQWISFIVQGLVLISSSTLISPPLKFRSLGCKPHHISLNLLNPTLPRPSLACRTELTPHPAGQLCKRIPMHTQAHSNLLENAQNTFYKQRSMGVSHCNLRSQEPMRNFGEIYCTHLFSHGAQHTLLVMPLAQRDVTLSSRPSSTSASATTARTLSYPVRCGPFIRTGAACTTTAAISPARRIPSSLGGDSPHGGAVGVLLVFTVVDLRSNMSKELREQA